jgi:hypothetical protein
MLRSPWVFAVSYCPEGSFPGKSTVHKQPFTNDEDQVILDFVRTNGAKNWNFLATMLDNRTAKQCRERWHNHLDPSIQKGPWSLEEDQILAEKQAVLGNTWAEIARFLPGRTDTLVKNRWNTSVRARVAVDVAGRIKVLPAHTAPVELFDGAATTMEPDLAEGGGVVAWLDAFGHRRAADGHSMWNEWLPPLLKR